jgi:hypothetical protein
VRGDAGHPGRHRFPLRATDSVARSDRVVPRQGPTRPDRAGPSQTFPDELPALICGNRTYRDVVRRNRAAWHADA